MNGHVAKAVRYVDVYLTSSPAEPLLLKELRSHLGITYKANFNRTVRRHKDFMAAMEARGLHEAIVGDGVHENALQRIFQPIDGGYDCNLE